MLDDPNLNLPKNSHIQYEIILKKPLYYDGNQVYAYIGSNLVHNEKMIHLQFVSDDNPNTLTIISVPFVNVGAIRTTIVPNPPKTT